MTREEKYVIIPKCEFERGDKMTTSTRRIRHSTTRDKIYEYLCGTKSHPSADTIYNELKPSMPSLSIGTVYTNLRLFEEQGLVIRVANVNGNERYDANTKDHVHFVCDKCGSVIDIMDADITAAKKACQVGQAKISSIQIILHGTCEKCSG